MGRHQHPQAENHCRGCKNGERVPDSKLWELFNTSGTALQKQAEQEAQAMGWHGHFQEFVPVRYAVQLVNGERFFIKVQVQPKLFIDALFFRSFSSSNDEPTLQGIRVG